MLFKSLPSTNPSQWLDGLQDLVDRLVIFRSNYFIGGEGVNATNLLNKKKKITFKPTQISIVKNNTMEILERQNY